MFTALLIGIGVYALLCVAVWLGQRRFIYFPYTPSAPVLAEWAAKAGLEPWLNRSGERIGWMRLSPAGSAKLRVLVTHGNAGCAVQRSYYADALRAAGADVFFLEYPGYGGRAGEPGEQSFCAAAEEAYALLAEEGSVHLIGESLGTGVAAYLASKHPDRIAGLLLVAPYHNFSDLAQRHMPLFPVRWMLRDRFPSDEYLRQYRGPVGVLLAGRDEVVPNEFGRRLYEEYAGPKRLWVDDQASHNSVCEQSSKFWAEVIALWGASRLNPPQP